MSPVTHGLLSYLVAESARLSRRDRALVTAAGVIPDLDGLGFGVELLTRDSEHPLLWFSQYHHLFHNILFALLVAGAVFAAARRRWTASLLALAAVHLHYLCDLVGARGPDGAQWPLPYLWPFDREQSLVWSGQWPLNGWPNFALTGAALALVFFLAWRRGYSPVGLFSERADAAFVGALRGRFGTPVP